MGVASFYPPYPYMGTHKGEQESQAPSPGLNDAAFYFCFEISIIQHWKCWLDQVNPPLKLSFWAPMSPDFQAYSIS